MAPRFRGQIGETASPMAVRLLEDGAELVFRCAGVVSGVRSAKKAAPLSVVTVRLGAGGLSAVTWAPGCDGGAVATAAGGPGSGRGSKARRVRRTNRTSMWIRGTVAGGCDHAIEKDVTRGWGKQVGGKEKRNARASQTQAELNLLATSAARWRSLISCIWSSGGLEFFRRCPRSHPGP